MRLNGGRAGESFKLAGRNQDFAKIGNAVKSALPDKLPDADNGHGEASRRLVNVKKQSVMTVRGRGIRCFDVCLQVHSSF